MDSVQVTSSNPVKLGRPNISAMLCASWSAGNVAFAPASPVSTSPPNRRYKKLAFTGPELADRSAVILNAPHLLDSKPGPALLTPNYTSRRLSSVMQTVNALELRQSLGKVLDRLERDGAPIVVCRRRTPAAALVSLKDYRERFVDREADQRRRDIVARLKQLKFKPPTAGTTLDLLRDLRS